MSAPTEASSLKRLIITPAISRLAFCMDRPADWQPIDLPQQTPNFDEPTNFFSLAVLMPVSATAPTLVSIGARPAYGDGSVYDWAQFAMNHHNITFTQLMPGNVNGYPAIRAMGSQPSEDGPMQLAMAFIVDGESFLQITAMAPAAAWPELEKLFESMINSFALLRPQGATVGLIPGQKPPLNDANFKALALSESSATLTDPDLKLKAYMRDNGIGLLPHAASVNEQERFAMMACGSVMAAIPVPFGWYIMDDGKRTLVFTGDNAIQISISNLPTVGLTIDQGMDNITQGMLKEQPQVEHHKLDMEGTPTLAFKGLVIGGEALNQVFMFTPSAIANCIMQTRVTCSEAD